MPERMSDRMSKWACLALLCACALVPWRSAHAQSASGRALYESRCGECHDRSVHQRAARSARDFAQIRMNVVRWAQELDARWSPPEIDAVSRYLNETYYHFPCPVALCKADRAALDLDRARR